MLTETSYTENVRSVERSMVFERFLYVSLLDAIDASRTGFLSCGTVCALRVSTVVEYQRQESQLFL